MARHRATRRATALPLTLLFVFAGAACSASPAGAPTTLPSTTPTIPRPPDITVAQVKARAWQTRVTAPAAGWSSSLQGSGTMMELDTAGSIVGQLNRLTATPSPPDFGAVYGAPKTGCGFPQQPPSIQSDRYFVLPGGAEWFELGTFTVDTPGDGPFSQLRATWPPAGRQITATTSLSAVVAAGGGRVALTGTFVAPSGAVTEHLIVSTGTALRYDNAGFAGFCSAPASADYPLTYSLPDAPDLSIRVAGGGEVAIVGQATAQALGGSWNGLVGSLVASHVIGVATRTPEGWTLTASGQGSTQVWVDGWPMVNTRLTARSDGGADLFDPWNLGLAYANHGSATAQITSVQAVGGGAPSIYLGLSSSAGHDAGLGLYRIVTVANLLPGKPIPTELAPGSSQSVGIDGTGGTLAIQGNFPEIIVTLKG